MRPRLKKNLDTRLEKCSFLLEEDPEARKGAWDFGKSEVHLEIGACKGAFICGRRSASGNNVCRCGMRKQCYCYGYGKGREGGT